MSEALRRRDKWIPWYFVMFFVGLAIIDGIFVTIAFKTHTGVITDHPYEKGLAYNEVVAASAMQDALGWHGALTHVITAPNTAQITLHVTGSDGTPITLTNATANIMRPTQSGMDFSINMKPVAGAWQADIAFPEPGLWEIRIFAGDATHRFQQSKRIVIE